MADEELKFPRRYYVPGDEIVLRIELSHLQNLEEVQVGYGKDGERYNTMTFIGEVEDTVDVGQEEVPGPEQGYVPHASPYQQKRSTVVLRMLVDVDHTPGHYELRYAKCRTVAGQNVMVWADSSNASIKGDSFRVLQEPPATPEVSVELIDEGDLQDSL